MELIRVSVVIPAYNEEKLIERCLASLQAQTVAPYEIIVIDNNSHDATAAIAKSHGAIVAAETAQGIAWARDAGFNRASGDIIARLDADCIAPPQWVEIITNYYQKQPLSRARAITGMGFYTLRPRFIGKLFGTLMSTGFNIGNTLMIGNVALFGSCMAFPRQWWDEVKADICHDSAIIHEDIDLSIHIMREGHSIERLPGFFTYIDSRTLYEPPKKTMWRWQTWPRSVYRHGRPRNLKRT